MTTETTPTQPDARAEALVGAYERAGYRRVAPPILQPAEPFLDLSGEDIRKRMYLTTDADGRELCLRPDLTIPVSRDYLASPAAGTRAGLLLSRPGVPPPRRAAGRVPAGRHRILRADRQGGGGRRDAGARPRGDRALRHRRARDPHRRRRAVLGAGRGARSGAGLEAAAGQGFQPQDLARARSRRADAQRGAEQARNTRACWRRWPAPIRRPRMRWSPTCSRSPASPRSAAARSARSPSASSSRRRSALPPRCRGETRALIERFLAIAGDPDEAAAELRALAAAAGLALEPALDLFESRTGFLAARGVDVGRIRFSTAFGRGLDYYTGFVFELHDPARGAERPAGRRRTLRRAADPARRQVADPRGRLRGLDRARRRRRSQP